MKWKMQEIICMIAGVGKCKEWKRKERKMQGMENTRNRKWKGKMQGWKMQKKLKMQGMD